MRPFNTTSAGSRQEAQKFLIPFVVLLASYCVWIFTLPLFPSLDGSLHLYYASVMGSLLSGSKDFASYYFIRHLLPPYALHYYFLIATGHFFGYAMADKLLVCLIFIATACGFRYLARCLGPSGDVMSLFILPLLLNWPLGMGFYNYCLSVGLALWAMGLWYRAVQRRSHRLWVAFLITVVLMLLTHPVPLLFVYLLVGIDVLCRVIPDLRTVSCGDSSFRACLQRYQPDVTYLLLAWATIGYVFLFVGRHRVVSNILQTYNRKVVLIKLIKLSTLAMFSGSHPSVIVYRLSLYAILLLAFLLASVAARKQWKNRIVYTPASAILACSLLLAVAIPILPPVMNGANYFSQRLVILVWIGAIASASAYPAFVRQKQTMLAICLFLYSISVLLLANHMIRPVAAEISEIESAPLHESGLTGLTLSLPDAPISNDLDYVPYYWVGARYFRRSRSVLLNGGWLYESYVPLGSHIDELSEQLSPSYQDSPGDTYQLLLHSSSAREKILPHVNLLLFTGEISAQQLPHIVEGLDRSEPSRHWACKSHGWYSVCTAPFAVSATGQATKAKAG